MTLINPTDDAIRLVMKPGDSMKMPCRGVFSKFPKLRIVSITQGGKVVDATYYPNSGSIPSTRHSETVRLINLDWLNIKVNVEYSSTTGLVKVINGNVESVTIEIK